MKKNFLIAALVLLLALSRCTPSAADSCYNNLQEEERSGYAYRLAAENMEHSMQQTSKVIADYVAIVDAALRYTETLKGENPLKKRLQYLMTTADADTRALSEGFANARVFMKIAKDKQPLPSSLR